MEILEEEAEKRSDDNKLSPPLKSKPPPFPYWGRKSSRFSE